jgi:hypothetical protein
VVVAGERLDGVERVPEREHDELDLVAEWTAEHVDAAVAGGLS